MAHEPLKKPDAPLPVFQETASQGEGEMMLALLDGGRGFYEEFGDEAFVYFICHRTEAEWEIGAGHMKDAQTLVRDAVIASSNADAPVAFSVGEKDVFHDICDLI